MPVRPLKVSIVTPSFNQGGFIEETILSVLGQDYPHIEYLIVDGGSTDGTVDVIRKYEGHIAFWVSEPDSGQSDAINRGWKKSTGDIIAWLNADDTYCPGAVSAVAEAFGRDPDAILVHGATHTVTQDGRDILFTSQPLDMDPYAMIAGCGGVTAQPSIFFRRSVLDEVGYLDPHLHYVMDWEYCIRLGIHFGNRRYKKVPAVLSNNRYWPGNKTNQRWKAFCEEHRAVFERIFAKSPDDPVLQRIRDAAYRSSFRRQADFARWHGEKLEAVRSVYEAWRIGPFSHNPLRDLYLLFHIVIGNRSSITIQRLLRPVARRLDRVTGL